MPPPPSNVRIAVVGLVSLALAMGIGRFAFTPLLPMMRDDGLVGIAGGGWLASVHFLGYWLGAMVAATVPCPPRTLLRLSLAAIGLATWGMGATEDFAFWLTLRWVSGVASAWVLVLVSNFTVKHLAEHGRAAHQGWVFSGVGAGIAVAGLGALGFMVMGTGSAGSWQIMGALSLVAALAVSMSVGPEIPAQRPPPPGRGAGRAPLDWRAVLAYGAMGIGYVIPATYLPVMARDIVADPLVFGWSWPVFGAAAFASTPLAARLRRRYSDRQIWAASQAVMAAGLLPPAIYPHMAAIIAAGLSVGGTFMIVTMAGMKEAHRIAPPEDVMRHIAAMTAAFATGQMIGPVFASALYGLTPGFQAALIAASAALALTAAALVGGAGKGGVRP